MDECLKCKGALKDELVTRVQQYNGQWFLIENVPAKVCRQCGETYYTPETHDRVVRLLQDNPTPIRVETLPVLDAS